VDKKEASARPCRLFTTAIININTIVNVDTRKPTARSRNPKSHYEKHRSQNQGTLFDFAGRSARAHFNM
jgi:hypothetical protein